MPKTTKTFRSGNSQVVRKPKGFRLDANEVEVSGVGDVKFLQPLAGKNVPWQHLRVALYIGFSPDFMEQGRQQPEDQ